MSISIKKNDIIDLKIEDVTIGGDGVGRFKNITVFVPMCAVGDYISARIIKIKSSYLIGKIEKIIERSPDRIECDCPIYYKCGGCTFRHISYNAELKIKQKHVKDCLERIGGLKDVPVEKIIGAEKVCGYRNKAQIPLGTDKEENIISGFYGRHSHNIMSCSRCLLHPEIFDEITTEIKLWMKEYSVSSYNENTQTGNIRHIFFRCSKDCKDIMVCLVSAKKIVPFKSQLINILIEKFKSIKSIVFNYNCENTNVVLGKKFEVAWGSETITDELCGMKFEISPESFYQINHDQTQKLYCMSKKMLDLSGNETLLDLYCGIGTIGLTMADSVKGLTGAEIVEKAVTNACKNARLNNIENARFICVDSENAIKRFFGKLIDIVIIDPPRKGCSDSFLDDLIKIGPKKILYISCNPATLSKNLKKICMEKYMVSKICPIDLFPRTGHVETAALICRKD